VARNLAAVHVQQKQFGSGCIKVLQHNQALAHMRGKHPSSPAMQAWAAWGPAG